MGSFEEVPGRKESRRRPEDVRARPLSFEVGPLTARITWESGDRLQRRGVSVEVVDQKGETTKTPMGDLPHGNVEKLRTYLAQLSKKYKPAYPLRADSLVAQLIGFRTETLDRKRIVG